jgi:hypothetical protein
VSIARVRWLFLLQHTGIILVKKTANATSQRGSKAV